MKCIEPGHKYILSDVANTVGQAVVFMKKDDGKVVHDGTTNEEVLEMLIDRMRHLDKTLPCVENGIVIFNLVSALKYLNNRTVKRVSQCVEGTDRPHT